MSVISVRFTKEEEAQLRQFSQFINEPVSKILKDAFFEKLENEFDLKVINIFEEKEKNGKLELVSHEDVLKEFNL